MNEYEPITTELRETIRSLAIDDSVLTIGGDDFHRLCDTIDAVHAGLERENAELRERVAKLDKQGDSMHIGSATVTITDELRKWAEGDALRAGMSLRTARDQALAIADRIDAEHEAKVSYWQGASYKDGYDEGFASADDWLAQHEDAMAEHGWVQLLPKDADGEPIHIGDEMCGYGWPNGGVYCRAIVNEVTILVGPQDGAYRGWLMWAANECRHHHAPTVEDVLTKFGIDWEYEDNCEDRAALLAEYASKLRLAEVVDE